MQVSSLKGKKVNELRRMFVLVGRRIFEEKLTSGSGGQISARIPDSDFIMIKPSGFSLGHLEPEDMVIIDRDGTKIAGKYNPSGETPFHTNIYKARPDVGAVVHTHSIYATAFGMVGKGLLPIWIEAFTLVRGVPVAPYARSGSEALTKVILEKIGKDKNAVILQNHGIVSLGANLEDAFQTARDVEWLAQMQYVAMRLGEPKLLESSEVEWIEKAIGVHPMGELRRTYGNPEKT
jgi:L-fuculose-phosphate aldolase